MKRRIILAGLVCILLVTMVGCGNSQSATKENSWNRVKKDKKIIVGLDDTFVPMGFRDESDNIMGFDIDLARDVFAQYNIEPIFQPIDWSMKESELSNGSIDLIWNGYTINDERKEKVLFSNSYMENKQILVTLKNSGVQSVKDMDNKILGVQNASSGLTLIEKNPEILIDRIDGEPILFDTFNEALIDLKAKRIDAVVIDKGYAEYYISKQDDPSQFSIVDTPFPDEEFGIGMRKNDLQLKQKIDEALQKLAETGQIKKIQEKWFGQP